MAFTQDHREDALDMHFHAHRQVQARIAKDRNPAPTDRQIEQALEAAGVPQAADLSHDLKVARVVLEAFA
jgi:hypothetical protein